MKLTQFFYGIGTWTVSPKCFWVHSFNWRRVAVMAVGSSLIDPISASPGMYYTFISWVKMF